MKLDKDYTFEVSLSNDAYADKIISAAMIGSSKNEENRRIRKEYGFPANKGIGYTRTTTNAESLLNALLDGHVFCHLFNPATTRKDGSFGSSEKKDENFDGSYIIGVDIDRTSYPTVEMFISQLSLKPTFYYTTYSNLKEDKGARFRLIYVFDTKIENPYFFRYAAYCLNQLIEKETKEKIDDDCNLRCSQYFNGTNRNNDNIILSYGLTNYVYSFEDISVSTDGYVDYLRNYCYYKTYSRDRVISISNILYNITNKFYSFNSSTTYYIELQNDNTTDKTCNININTVLNSYNTTITHCNEDFVTDMVRLDYDEFMKHNRHKYHYYYRVEKEEWIDGIFQYIDDDYFSLYWNATTVKDGQKRRKKLFERMCLRRVINPSVDADTLLFNAYEDVHRFFEIDKDLTIDCLVKNVERAMQMDIEDIKMNYSNIIKFLKSRRPKSGIIVRPGVTGNIAERNRVLRIIRYSLMADYYDASLTAKENVEIISNNLFRISLRTFYNFLHEFSLKTDNKKVTDEELKTLLDINLSIRDNMTVLKNKGIKVGNKRVMKILNSLKDNISVTKNDNADSNDIVYNNTNNYQNFSSSSITTYYTDLQTDNTQQIQSNAYYK